MTKLNKFLYYIPIKILKLPLVGYLISAIIAVYASVTTISAKYQFSGASSAKKLTEMGCVAAVIFVILCGLMIPLFKYVFASSYVKHKLVEAAVYSIVMSFVVFIFVPAQSFFFNFADYAFPYKLLINAVIGDALFVAVIGTLVLPLFKKKVYYPLYYGLTGLMLAVYAQYMFLNSTMGTIDGTTFDWTKYVGPTFIDLAIWIVLIVGPVIAGIKWKDKLIKIFFYVTVFVGLIHGVTYATLLIQADKACYEYAGVYFNYDDQYHVASKENIIVFVIDAVDNDMINEIWENNPEVMAEFSDFIMYTDTCSVYDYTSKSLLQMATNFEFDGGATDAELRQKAWSSEETCQFYGRLHEAGYKTLYYNFDNENTEGVIGKFDNAVRFDNSKDKPAYIDYKLIKVNAKTLGFYTIYPNILKGSLKVENVSFRRAVYMTTNLGDYENDDYAANVNISIGDMDKCVMYQHLAGAHTPNENVETVIYCMGIVDNYLDQMKALNLYDAATIIIVSDHGRHDYSETTGNGMKAATPMFMIKPGKNVTREDILANAAMSGEKTNERTMPRTNNAPIYLTDMMPTILCCANLYRDGDEAIYGKTVFDYKEGDVRTRIWYDRVRDEAYPMTGTFNTLYGYEYTGNTKELERVVESGQGVKVYPVVRMWE